jgi:hypothetical protein
MTRPTLVEFLTARLDEDEAVAQRAGQWRAMRYDFPPDRRTLDIGGELVLDVDVARMSQRLSDAAAHALRHDPARVLADVKAKRAIVDFAAGLMANGEDSEPWAGEEVLVRLASVYADHPDYDATWSV